MSNGQRLILACCAFLLCGYLAALAGRVISPEQHGADESAASAEDPAPQIVDGVAALSDLGVSIKPYRHGVMKPDGAAIHVERNGEDGFGVFLIPAGIKSNRVIRFEAKGDERVIVRSTILGEREYRNAGSDDFLRLTPQTDEILIFTNDANYIDVSILSAVDCSKNWDAFCADERYLAEKIGVSGTWGPNKDELLKILDWTANSIVWSGDREITAEANAFVKKYTAAQMYATVFESESAGGFCGAAAIFLSKVLNDLGYQALTINFGTGPNLTHVSTLVYDPFGDGKFYMVDPTFNAIFVNETSGDWIPFDDLLAGETEGVKILEHPVEGRRFLTTRPSSALTSCRPAKGRKDANICSRPGYNFNAYMASFDGAFEEAGLTPDKSGYMHMLRETYFNIGNQSGSDVREKFIALLKKNNIAIAN